MFYESHVAIEYFMCPVIWRIELLVYLMLVTLNNQTWLMAIVLAQLYSVQVIIGSVHYSERKASFQSTLLKVQ